MAGSGVSKNIRHFVAKSVRGSTISRICESKSGFVVSRLLKPGTNGPSPFRLQSDDTDHGEAFRPQVFRGSQKKPCPRGYRSPGHGLLCATFSGFGPAGKDRLPGDGGPAQHFLLETDVVYRHKSGGWSLSHYLRHLRANCTIKSAVCFTPADESSIKS